MSEHIEKTSDSDGRKRQGGRKKKKKKGKQDFYGKSIQI